MLSDLITKKFNPIMPLLKTRKIKNQKRVLIIDDDQDMSGLLKAFLGKDELFLITTAQDPFDAMNMLTEQVFDLIVLDWNLPKMNGLETLLQTEKWFRCDPNLLMEWDNKKVPVVIFSANEKSACKAPNSKHFRYSGYINKSNPIETIITSLKQYIQSCSA